jgi:hypothetical protein
MAVVAVATVAADIDFYFYEFQKYISGENKFVPMVEPDFVCGIGSWLGSACARAAGERVG